MVQVPGRENMRHHHRHPIGDRHFASLTPRAGRPSHPARAAHCSADGVRGARHAARVRHPHQGIHPPPQRRAAALRALRDSGPGQHPPVGAASQDGHGAGAGEVVPGEISVRA